ncbi:D-alanyl-D-alanine carboxypeptidase family protein [Nonomuraea spiralis]|uniref:D-alanyl-D-alanine carboxypeptidase family protein n=1 Tax=Nonomuraea spiralis TaxID=46182 RepID=A0ABV5IFM9_9ACTN|nr:D-alanyl-D-alanine carboxypeptidase family protein [Nonomuraea spiralis]GGS72183.1 D-alanyl-D-alanine carboxypeptidase [Nonomuraea spiralis]
MRNRKARLTAFAGAVALVTGLGVPAYAQAAVAPAPAVVADAGAPAVYGRAAYLMDAASGAALYGKDATTRMPIASLTKTMTAYVVLDSAKPTDMVEITAQDARYAEDGGGTTADLRPGDRLPVSELLYALMLPSGADAAHALARTYGPGVPGFVAKMNATARSLGMNDTHYVNADGLPTPAGDGWSTARDQAVLGAKALQVPLIEQVAGTRYHTVAATGEHGSYGWRNTNRLLSEPGAIGLKTGFTRAAGYSLAFAGEQEGHRLVGVILGESVSSRRFSTAESLLTWGAARTTP